MQHLCVLLLFQFHKGTIKTYYMSLREILVYVFQFHKGTIKTTKKFITISIVSLKFQFHKGTIKTSCKAPLFSC